MNRSHIYLLTGEPRVGKTSTIKKIIDKALATKPLIIVDEIGPMQAYSEPFKKAIMDILASSRPLLATIALEPHPWLDELKQQKGVELYTLNPENQKQIIDTLTDRLKSLLNKDR